MSQRKREGMTLDEIVAKTGMNKSALYRYLSEPDIRALLAPTGNPVTYREELLPVFHVLAKAHADKMVKPKTAIRLVEQQIDELKQGLLGNGSPLMIPDSETRNSDSDSAELMVVPESGIQKPRTEIRTEARRTDPDASVHPESEILQEFLPPIVSALERIAASADSRKALDLLTVSEVAALLQMSESWVSRHVPKTKLGRSVRYSREQIARFISESEIK